MGIYIHALKVYLNKGDNRDLNINLTEASLKHRVQIDLSFNLDTYSVGS